MTWFEIVPIAFDSELSRASENSGGLFLLVTLGGARAPVVWRCSSDNFAMFAAIRHVPARVWLSRALRRPPFLRVLI